MYVINVLYMQDGGYQEEDAGYEGGEGYGL